MSAASRGSRAEEFDGLYGTDPDPWQMATSAYERSKYEATVGALPQARFSSTIELGCSIGVLSRMLAERSERFLGVDVSKLAVDAARRRNADLCHARFLRAEVPEGWPSPPASSPYDLIVLSEILYFLEPAEVVAIARLSLRDLAPGGYCLLVNWTGPCDRALDGHQAARLFLQAAGPELAVTLGTTAPRYRIDLLRRV